MAEHKNDARVLGTSCWFLVGWRVSIQNEKRAARQLRIGACAHTTPKATESLTKEMKKGMLRWGQSRKALPTLLVAAASRKPSKKNIKRESPQLCERTPVRVERKEMEGGLCCVLNESIALYKTR